MKHFVRSNIVAVGLIAAFSPIAIAQRTIGSAIPVRPAMLAGTIEALAGYDVDVQQARIVGVFNPRVFVVDTAAPLRPMLGNRARVLVFIGTGSLAVPTTVLVGSTVRISGVARTLLGMQVTAEVPWPSALRPDVVERLEIRAAVLARSVRTAEGVELTGPGREPQVE